MNKLEKNENIRVEEQVQFFGLIAVSLFLCDRHYAPERADISEAVVKEIDKYDASLSEMDEADQFESRWQNAEFMKDLAVQLMDLINYGKNKDAIISIMAQ